MIRAARVDDLPALCDMARAMVAEAPEFAGLEVTDAGVRSTLEGWLRLDGTFVSVAGDGSLAGVAIGWVAPFWFATRAQEAGELAIYVRPEHRGGNHMKRLVAALEAWAREKGAERITLGVSTGRKTEAVAKLYERMGYRRAGVTLVRDIGP